MIQRKHSDKRKVYKCGECGKTYLNSDSLKKHKIMHMGRYLFTITLVYGKIREREGIEFH